MSRRQEFLTYEGLRLDGRRPNEIRYLTLKIGDAPNADGSATLQQGLTKVVAHVFGPRPLQAASTGRASGNSSKAGEAIVNVVYRTASFATIDRKRRTTGDRNSTERQLWLQRTIQDAEVDIFRLLHIAGDAEMGSQMLLVGASSVRSQLTYWLADLIMWYGFPRSCIDVNLTILQEDGSALAACTNAAAAALVDAGIPIKDMFGACTVGLVNNQRPVVDINHAEAQGCGGAMVTVAVYQRRKEDAK
ncbi:Exosome complex component RRP41 [Perkinsus chesapeaki]|uniref:Exosome complex component RRP41 n=1 Tax=Perkinsus chesapeaki TaxID=330153 RepID=A0A7J6KSB1_PERCH|nr:Exosome complex component RRP41 [Perkinsus chesapeaki]